MDGSVFRTKVEPQEPVAEKPIGKSEAAVIDSKVDPPYLDWEHEKGKPYIAEYFGLDDLWKDKVGGFEEEINTIKKYVQNEIEQGRLDNSADAVKTLLKEMEKQMGADKTERNTIKIAQMAAYTEFLYKTRNIKLNQQKYGYK
jgi:Arc/MetJ-type ribon-helix-helix transcriptional regulator